MKKFWGKSSRPAYTCGTYAPGKPYKKICPNCGRRIDFDAVKCEFCKAEKENGWKTVKSNSEFDLNTDFVSLGGLFPKGCKVTVFAKKGKIVFKSELGGKFVNIKKDFFLCVRRKSDNGAKVSLVFSDFIINMNDNDSAEEIISYIYNDIVDKIFETKEAFYNATHELFPL